MALQRAYKQFLASPNSALLSDDASLHYITTLTSVHGAADIIKHLGRQTHELKKKEEKFLSAVEGPEALAVELQSTIEFVNGGGAYLPSLDDNFLADRTVQLAIVCNHEFRKRSVLISIRFILSTSMRTARSSRFDSTGTKALSLNKSTSLAEPARTGLSAMAKIRLN
jgi:hypothetical protein